MSILIGSLLINIFFHWWLYVNENFWRQIKWKIHVIQWMNRMNWRLNEFGKAGIILTANNDNNGRWISHFFFCVRNTHTHYAFYWQRINCSTKMNGKWAKWIRNTRSTKMEATSWNQSDNKRKRLGFLNKTTGKVGRNEWRPSDRLALIWLRTLYPKSNTQ